MRLFVISAALMLAASSAFADPVNVIDGSYLSVSILGTDFDSTSATDVDQLSFSLADSQNYTLTGVLKVSPVVPVKALNANLANNGALSTPFTFNLATFIDLTDLTLTCTQQTGSCGSFSIGFEVYLDPISSGETLIPVSASIVGSGPGGMDLFSSASIESRDNSFSLLSSVNGSSNSFIPTGGQINTQLFSSSLNVSGATNISFFGNFGSETGLAAGETLLLPNSFTAVLGAAPSAVPEPGTVWMLFGGAAALAWLRKRKQS